MSLWRRAFTSWLPVAVAVTCLGLLGYGAVQQVYRTGADDPQVQMAHDAAAAIAAGASPSQVVEALGGRSTSSGGITQTRPAVTLDSSDERPGGSLAPFLIVYDSAGRPFTSTAWLGGEIPIVPKGVLDAAKASGENRVTWQPRPDVRIAAVAVPVGKGEFVVVAGRSLAEAERRVRALTQLALGGWLVTLVASFAAALLGQWLGGRGSGA